MPIFYREQQIGTRRADFLVEDSISVELKAVSQLEDVHLAQAKNYLEAYNLEIGLRACLNLGFAGEKGQSKVLRKRFLRRVAVLRGDKNANAGSCYGIL